MKRERAVSYWLVPSRESAAPFEQVIAGLTTQQGVAAFAPHLTLGTLTVASTDAAMMLRQMQELALEPVSIDGTEAFTTSLFVRFRPSKALQRMRAVIETSPAFRRGRDFDPHISLCYGAAPIGARASQKVKDLLSAPVIFDHIVAMSVELPITCHADLHVWRPLETFFLGSD
ncbi:MAG: 2'-5' RNA ligase family protein [Hyphomonadaceae bacterium]|nr:2'-5' RNA ligase family protein [Hyphomonadaceae bacterium]